MRKPRPIGPLSSLTAEQKQQLRRWYDTLSYGQIQTQIALPPPDAFSLNVSVWQLRRYRLSLDDSSAPSDSPSVSTLIDRAALGETFSLPPQSISSKSAPSNLLSLAKTRAKFPPCLASF